MRRRQGCVILVAGMLLNGCAELRTLHQNNSSNAPSSVQSERTSLLVSLRHDPNYGLIQYADVEVLYRDLTKAHPSRGTDAVHDLSMSSSSTQETVTAGTASEWKLATTDWMPVKTSIPETPVETPLDFGSITFGISASRNREMPALSVAAAAESVATQLSSSCETADAVKVNDEIWLASRRPERWTIQILSAPVADAACLDDESLTAIGAAGARRFSVYFKNELWNIVVVGDFASADEALTAASGFNEPWIREIGELRERRCNSVDHMPRTLQMQLRRWCSGRKVSHQTLPKAVTRAEIASAEALTFRSPYAR